ncbi:hypothetical protein APR52_14255 [Variovorax paradoxus]|jgi:hypothetical protein|nr:hypothetical protein APR52_14255 [Variovorax paradoxus]
MQRPVEWTVATSIVPLIGGAWGGRAEIKAAGVLIKVLGAYMYRSEREVELKLLALEAEFIAEWKSRASGR